MRRLGTPSAGSGTLLTLGGSTDTNSASVTPCRGGLIEHVLSMCALSRLVGAHYPQVDVDLLPPGAILHDIGKLEELSYARSFGYSSDGQLLGHISSVCVCLTRLSIGCRIFRPGCARWSSTWF